MKGFKKKPQLFFSYVSKLTSINLILKFDVQNSFAHFSATMNPSEAVLYAKRTGVSPLSRHIESRS